MKSDILEELNEHKLLIDKVIENNLESIENSAKEIIKSLKNGGKVLLCGNGGSAADAQHISAELTGRYKTERLPLPAIALTTDTSAITAIGNDYGYDTVFSRQTEALAKSDDILIGISTSGNSQNVINAFEVAKKIGCKTISLVGKDGGKMSQTSDISIIIPSDNTPRIQEMHITIGHIICQQIDNNFTN
jgi:D-sedoheptulose 7-phosphate isomerase